MLRKSKKARKVFLIEHDITCLKVDAVVNFEQTGDLTGGMLHDLIKKAGGPQLEAECKDKVRSKWLDTGEAVLTGAHGIGHLKGIIHTVYPVAAFGLSASDQMALVKCHDNALRIACDKGFRRIVMLNFLLGHIEVQAFACLQHELPDEAALESTLYAVKAFLEQEGSSAKLSAVLFCSRNAAETQIYNQLMAKRFADFVLGVPTKYRLPIPAKQSPASNLDADREQKDRYSSASTVSCPLVRYRSPTSPEADDEARLARRCFVAEDSDACVHVFCFPDATPSEPRTDMQAEISGDAPEHEYDEVAENSYAEVPPDASLARIVSGSKAMQQAPYAKSQQLDPADPSDALISEEVESRIFDQTYPWDSNYRQGSQIGQGAFGKVFEAWRREDEGQLRKVAVKHVETRSEDYFERHMQEARLMLQFKHPYLLGCYEVYTYTTTYHTVRTYNVFVVMDCMSYGSLDTILAEMLENGAFFSEQSARYILYCCTNALGFLHARNIIHRDVKCANILVSNEGRAKLGDFGLSGNLDDGAGTSRVGTPRYMAPEIARKFVEYNSEAYTKEVDVFSLGVVGVELACGQLPHRVGTPTAIYNALCDVEFPKWLLSKMDECLTSREASWSSNYRYFVENCLCYEASKRMTSVELLTLELFSSIYS